MIGALATAVVLCAPQSPAPRLQSLQPAGATRGTEVLVTLRGERFGEPLAVLLDGPGIEVLALQGAANDRCMASLRVLADCPPGPHGLRLRSAAGLSNLLLFHVGTLPSLAEDQAEKVPQQVPLGCTIDGRLRDGEVDRYRLDVPAGATVHCEVEGMRLGMVPLDTALVVLGPDGKGLAWADDTALGGRDPWLSFSCAAAGTCIVELTGAVPGDGREGAYRLHIGTFARPVGALPCGGQPGQELEVELQTASAAGAGRWRERVRLPDDGSDVFGWYPQQGGGPCPTPVWLRVGGPPNREPQRDDKGVSWLELPCAVHGVVADPAAPPQFRWRGKKGEEVEFRVVARALRSALDPTLVLRGADGRFLSYNDDQAGMDSVLRFTPPADGEFTIEVRDLLRTGSPSHLFRLEAGPRDRAQRVAMAVSRGIEPVVAVPQGGHAAAVLNLTGFDAAASVAIADLPAGVTATLGPRLPGTTLVPVMFSATADASLAGAALRVGLPGDDGVLDARPFRQTLSLLAGRNDTPLVQTQRTTLPLAVTKPAAFTITAGHPSVPIVRGANLGLQLQAVRGAGFEGQLRVRGAWMPPGLSAGQVTIERGATTATLPIEAAANAPLGEFPCLVVATSRTNGTIVEVALPFVAVRVEAPWLEVGRAQARTKQGANVALRLPITKSRDRTQPATASLLGLPRGVTAAEATLATDGVEIVFAVQVAGNAAMGRHRNLTVEVRLPDAEGRPVLHRFPAGELRIDKAPAASVAGGSR